MKIREVMSSPAHVCRIDDTLEQAAALLWEHDCGLLPVVHADGRVCAAITDRDICMGAYTSGKRLADLHVVDSMSHSAVTCHDDEDLAAVGARMAEHQLHRLPVVDENGRPIGVVALNDLALQGERDQRTEREAWNVLVAASRHRTGVRAIATA